MTSEENEICLDSGDQPQTCAKKSVRHQQDLNNSWSKTQKIILGLLTSIIIILLTGLILMTVLYLDSSKPLDSPVLPTNNPSAEKLETNLSNRTKLATVVCSKPECVQAAADILDSMDKNYDPCTDFYKFACNGWISSQPIPKGKASWSVTNLRAEENIAHLRHLLEKKINISSSEPERKAKAFYTACIKSEHFAEEFGTEPLKQIIKNVGGWTLTPDEDLKTRGGQFNLRDKLLAVQDYTTDALFSWKIIDGMNDTSNHELFLHQGGLTLPSRMLYGNQLVLMTFRKLLTDTVTILMKNEFGELPLHIENVNIESQLNDLIEFEIFLSKITTDTLTGTFISLEDADKLWPLSPTWNSWTSFFNTVFMRFFQNETEKVFVTTQHHVWVQKSFLSSLRDALASPFKKGSVGIPDIIESSNINPPQPLELPLMFLDNDRLENTLNNYLTWRAIFPYLSVSSAEIQAVEREFWMSLQGVQGKEERWKECVSRTTSALGFALSPAFVRESFSESSRESAFKIITKIKEAFVGRLKELDWITDVSTRKSIEKKIENGVHLFGYPDFILNSTYMAHLFQGFDISEENYFQNQLNLNRFLMRRNLKLLNRHVDRTEWPLSFPPSTVNAFYIYSRNLMLFPAGVLQPPFFNEHLPMVFNFGHIGTLMGHELLHGFDQSGRLYSPEGNKKAWWPPSVVDSFEDRSECFVDEYSQSIEGIGLLDGLLTLSENIADIGGMIAAFRGYHLWLEDSTEPRLLLPGLEEFTDDQLFFIGFARSHCSNIQDKALELSLTRDLHSPDEIRVNTALKHVPEFSASWRCPKAPGEELCSLW